MKRVLILLLGISLAANAWLWLGRGRPAAAPVVRSEPAKTAPVAPLPMAAIDATDVAALRAAGLDDGMVRAVVEGVLRRRHKEKLAEIRTARTRDAWWRAGRTATAGEAKLLDEMVTEPMRRLLGPDPLEQADAESRYSFLPLDKRRLLAQIDRDYAELQARVPTVVNAQTQAELREQKLLAEERRKDVLAALTPEERAEYDLRYAGSATMVSRRAGTMAATEAEFRTIKPLLDQFDRASRMLGRDETFRAEVYDELKRTTLQQLVEKLGYDRAADYVWSAYDSEFGALRRAAEVAQLPATTPSRVMELMQETGRQAGAVHADATLSLGQKRAALVGLQQTAQAQLDALLPPAARGQLSAGTFDWLRGLSEGRYRMAMVDVLSSGGYMSSEVSTPLAGGVPNFPTLPPRPAGK